MNETGDEIDDQTVLSDKTSDETGDATADETVGDLLIMRLLETC